MAAMRHSPTSIRGNGSTVAQHREVAVNSTPACHVGCRVLVSGTHLLRFVCTVVIAFGIHFLPHSARGSIVRLEYTPQLEPQPLKGMEARSGIEGTFVWSWLVVSNVMRGMEDFDWTAIEARLEKNSKRGLHTILRPILDDTTRHSLVPRFLTRIEGATAVDFGGNVVPVYSHPATRRALVTFVEAFGARYDGDPRIGFVEVGLLGQWGEGWAPRGNGERTTEVTPEARDAVFQAYHRSFRKTHLLLPRPNTNLLTADFGFHNEAFAFWKDTERFYDALRFSVPDSLGRWRRSPINARVHPEYSSAEKTRNLTFDHITESRMVAWIEREHYSCIRLPSGDAMSKELKQRFIRSAQRAGYEFSASHFDFKQAGDSLRVQVTVTNMGVAPFYYPWPVELAVLENGRAARARSIQGDITQLIPGQGELVLDGTLRLQEIPERGATLLLRISNPLPNGPPIRFANQEQDRDVDGWLSLEVPLNEK